MDEDIGHRTLLVRSVMSTALRGGGAVLVLGFNVLAARYSGADSYGSFAFAFAIISIGTVVARLGLETVVLRDVARHDDRSDWTSASGVIGRSSAVVAVASAAIAVGLIAFAAPIATLLEGGDRTETALRVMAAGLVPFSLLTLLGEALKALHRWVLGVVVQSIVPPIIALAVLLTVSRNAAGIASAYVSGLLVGVLVAAVCVGRAIPLGRGTPVSLRDLLRAGRPLLWVSSLGLLLTMTDTIILGMFEPAQTVGQYSAAVRLAMLSALIQGATGGVLGPRMAVLWSRGEGAALHDLFRRSSVVMTMVGAAVGVVLVLLGGPMLEVFGTGFSRAWPALAILGVGQFVVLATGPAGRVLVMSGHATLQARATSIATVGNVALNLLLIPPFGMVGAAVATSAALTVKNGVTTYYARHIVSVAGSSQVR